MDNPRVAQPPTLDPSVDWGQTQGEILCPLCDYNLRGLPDPRCPECGYRFEWADLIDPARRRHPYLFEHHPTRKAWSFFRTVRGGLWPHRFWTSLHPAQPSYVRRLILYWFLACLPFLLVGLSWLFLVLSNLAQRTQQDRAAIIATFNNPVAALDPAFATLVQRFPNRAALDQYLDTHLPLPPSLRFLQRALRREWRPPWTQSLVRLVRVSLILFCWPWLTFLILLLYRMSMRRARIRNVHILRCVVYCSDVILWTAPAGALAYLVRVALVFGAIDPARLSFHRLDAPAVDTAGILVAGAFFLAFIWRLTIAYRSYLRFDHALATVLASQIIALLIVVNLLVERRPF